MNKRSQNFRNLPASLRFDLSYKKVNNCWLWFGTLDKDGYGHIWENQKKYRAHRYSWKLHYGSEPKGYVCHHCDTPSCVNPNHLFLGTQQDNRTDCKLKGRVAKGVTHGCVKLSLQEVQTIRKYLSEKEHTHKEIAEIFNVSRATITDINLQRSWN